MRELEIDELVKLISVDQLHDANFLEVGTYTGTTAAILAKRVPNALIISVDPFIDHDYTDPRKEFRSGAARIAAWKQNAQSNQRLWVGNLESFHAVNVKIFDIVLIDGDHDGKTVFRDLLYADCLLTPNGIIAVHDYREPDYPGINVAVNHFISSASWEIRFIESMAILRCNQ